MAEACSVFVRALADGDQDATLRARKLVAAAARTGGEAELTAGARVLAEAVPGLPAGRGAMAAPLLGLLVQAGGDPRCLDSLAQRAAQELEAVAAFVQLWRSHAPRPADGGEATQEAELPVTEGDDGTFSPARERLREIGAGNGISVQECDRLTVAWFTVGQWVQGLLIPLQRKQVRLSLAHRARLTAAASAAPDADNVSWLLGLLLTLDDEPLVVLHRASGRGYKLTISGIGDNFQLHTLLAATLIGNPRQGLIEGERPRQSWIAAATDGPPEPGDGVHGQFNLVDAFGKWVWNEGRPADIPLFEGVRVLILDPPSYPRSWNAGRAYPLMAPTVTVNEVLPADQAVQWLARVAPATSPFA